MKLFNFLTLLVFITSSVFLYTYQRIEAICLSYEINAKNLELNKLLDRKREMEYNVIKLKAPAYLHMQLAKRRVKLVMPERWQVFEMAELERESIRPVSPLFVRNILSLFSLDREAQAIPAIE